MKNTNQISNLVDAEKSLMILNTYIMASEYVESENANKINGLSQDIKGLRGSQPAVILSDFGQLLVNLSESPEIHDTIIAMCLELLEKCHGNYWNRTENHICLYNSDTYRDTMCNQLNNLVILTNLKIGRVTMQNRYVLVETSDKLACKYLKSLGLKTSYTHKGMMLPDHAMLDREPCGLDRYQQVRLFNTGSIR